MSNLNISEEIRKVSREHAPQLYKRLNRPQPDNLQKGQVWSTYERIELPNGQTFTTSEPKLVVILVTSENDPIAAPISPRVEMATEFDLIIPKIDSPLGFSFMIEAWNETPIIIKHLRHYLGSISSEHVDHLRVLHAAYLLDEVIPENVALHVGISLGDDEDSRREFQTSEIKAIEYLSRSASAFLNIALDERESDSRERVFRLGQPKWELLENIFRQKPSLAFAAGNKSESPQRGWFVVYEEQDSKLILELLVRKKREVYAHIHEIGINFENQVGVVVLHIEDARISSEPTLLALGVDINFGTHQDFQFGNTIIELEILDDVL